MSDPLTRLKLLMGGEEVFQAAEANAVEPRHVESQLEDNAQKDHTTQTIQESNTIAGAELRRTEPNLKDTRKWTHPASSNSSSDTNKQIWSSALRRAQRYLGLRGSSQTTTSALDPTQPASHTPDLDPIILSIDIEADEQNHSLITEIGISSLDTRSLANLPPGPNAHNWHSLIKGQHFRIAEYTYIRNHIFVTGDPESFNPEFGTSQIISLSQIANTIRECFSQLDPDTQALRNVILVGHNIKSDITWLRQLGVDLLTIPNLVEVLATEELQKALKRDSQGATNLGRLLGEMDIEAWNLHNAGNDAAYTLQAFVAIALKGLSGDRPVVGLEERVRIAVEKATERAVADWEGWIKAEERCGDGEEPVAHRFSKLRA